MACLDQHLKDPEYANWVKNTLALKLTLDVLKPFVHQELPAIQRSIINKGPPKATCSSCNVSRAPNCPNRVCNVYHNEIIDNHRYADPSFRNTNARKWTTDAWEIAKCFMPQMAGYKNCMPSDVDFSGIINIIINCKYFDALVSCDLNQDGTMFFEARNMRNMLMHSDNLKVSETDFQENLELLISLLSCLNDTPLNCPEAAEQIKKLKTGERPITLDDVVDARKQAVLAIWEEFDKGKQEIKVFVDLCMAQLRQGLDTTASIRKTAPCRLISNFVRGCKYSLISLVETECQRAKPKPCPQNEWNFKEFLKRFEQFPEVECLLDRHKRRLYPEDGSSSDIKKWDLFLLCYILTIERRVKLPNHVVNYVEELKDVRNKILDNPDRFGENDLNVLSGYLDEPLKTEVTRIFVEEYVADDALQLQIVLLSWRQNEDTMNSKPIHREYLELGKQFARRIEDLERWKEKVEEDRDNRKTNKEDSVKPMTAEIQNQNDHIYEEHEKYRNIGSMAFPNENIIETSLVVEPKNVDPEEEKQLQENITSKDRDKNISIANGGLNYFKIKENLDTAYIAEGSIILKVTCKSIDQLIRFWDSCMDGSAVRAFAKIRDDYREFLGCSTLDFDIVLTKKEVHRCLNHLVDRLSYRLQDKSVLEEIKVTSAQSVSDQSGHNQQNVSTSGLPDRVVKDEITKELYVTDEILEQFGYHSTQEETVTEDPEKSLLIQKRNILTYGSSHEITDDEAKKNVKMLTEVLEMLKALCPCEEQLTKLRKLQETQVTGELITRAYAATSQDLLKSISDLIASGEDASYLLESLKSTIALQKQEHIMIDYEPEMEKLKEEICTVMARKNVLENLVKEKEQMIEAKNTIIKKQEIETKHLQEVKVREVKELTEKINKLKKRKRELLEDIESETDFSKELNRQLRLKDVSLENLEEENQKIRSQSELQMVEPKKLKETMAVNEEQNITIMSLKDSVKMLEETKTELQRSRKDLEDTVAKLSAEKKKLEGNIDDQTARKEEEIRGLREKIGQLNDEREKEIRKLSNILIVYGILTVIISVFFLRIGNFFYHE